MRMYWKGNIWDVIPFLYVGLWNKRLPAPPVTQLYGGGIMMLTAGSVVKGILDIYGTTNRKLLFYPAAGGLMLISALVLWGFRNCRKKTWTDCAE